MAYLILVTGGARSGKSSYALHHSEQITRNRCFVATCPSVDPELDERITAHKQERQGRGWTTIEEESDLVSLLAAPAGNELYLIDCLTLWVNNLMYAAQQSGKPCKDHEISYKTNELLAACDRFSGTVVFVTNEVGMGIVPGDELTRRYRDLVGTCNRLIAKKADEVILVSCGIPLSLKKLSNFQEY